MNKRLGLYRQELGSRLDGGGGCQVSGSNCPSLFNQDLCKCTGGSRSGNGNTDSLVVDGKGMKKKKKKNEKEVDGVVDDEEVIRLVLSGRREGSE